MTEPHAPAGGSPGDVKHAQGDGSRRSVGVPRQSPEYGRPGGHLPEPAVRPEAPASHASAEEADASGAPVPAIPEPTGTQPAVTEQAVTEQAVTGQAVTEQAVILPRLLKVAGAVLGSTTVLTGLLFYFGRLHITGFFRHLRVNFTVLDLTPNDYLIRSADGLFVPMTTVAVTGLLVLWANRFLLGRLSADRRQQVLRVGVPAAAGVGLVLVVLSLRELFADRPLVADLGWVGGLALAGGVLLLAYAAHLARPHSATGHRSDFSALAEGGFALLLVTIGLFWAVGSYAIDVGAGRARETVAELDTAADAVLYSERSLRLAVAGVTEFRCQDPEAAYRFRYDGLKLVLQSGGQYLLVSAEWSRENGTAVLLPRTDAVRLEFATPGQRRSEIC